MKVLIRNIAMLLAVLCGTFTVYAQTGQNTPQSAEAKINVKTIEPLSVKATLNIEEDIKLIKGETRVLEGITINYVVSGEPNERVELQYFNPTSEKNGKVGVSYSTTWKKGTSTIPSSSATYKLGVDGNGLTVRCILKSVTATADADLGEHIHEFTITVIYADY